MALFRCNKCGHIREVGNDYIGKSVKCPKCSNFTQIYDTIKFVEAVIKKYIIQSEELKRLQQGLTGESDNGVQSIEAHSVEEIDIYNTKALTHFDKYSPIVEWFDNRKIEVQINEEAIDTTGFFDEIALSLGNNYSVLKFVSDQIKYIQNKGFDNLKLQLSNKSKAEIQLITSFCKEMHDYSFVAKYYHQKNDKVIRLTLQKAPKVREFFNGIWMEWFTLMKLLEFFRKHKLHVSCMRNLDVSFPSGDSNELDIFFLTKNKTPVYIECKTGEFRQDINKYLKLKNRLNIDKSQFIICVFGLDKDQMNGMTSMYDLTFANEESLISHIEKIILMPAS